MGLFEATGDWIVALGKTIAHTVWLGSLVLLMLRLILRWVPQGMSRFRYRISVLTLLLFALTSVALFLSIYSPDGNAAATLHSGSGFLARSMNGSVAGNPSEPGSGEWAFYVLCCYAYLFGLLVMLFRSMHSIWHLGLLKRTGEPVEGEWYERFIRIRSKLGLNRRVVLLASEKIGGPAVAGLFRPVILVPLGMFTQLSVQQVETILLHELYHCKRLDILVNMVQMVLENLFFYHPAIWIISKMIRAEREHCCDDLVLQSYSDPLVYAGALLKLAGDHKPLNILATGAGGQDRFQLLHRVKRILNLNVMKTNLREKLFAIMLFAAGAVSLLAVYGFTSGLAIFRTGGGVEGSVPFVNGVTADQRQELLALQPDTVPLPDHEARMEASEQEPEEASLDAMEDIRWDEINQRIEDSMKDIDWDAMWKEVEKAHLEAMEEIDWEEFKQEMEQIRKEALEEIDWEALKQEMEEARKEAMVAIDWEELWQETEEARKETMEAIDWEELWQEMEEARKEAMEAIDWDELKQEMEEARKEAMEAIDWEELKQEMEEARKEAMEAIDWEGLREEMENMKIRMDSLYRQDHI